MNTLVSQHLPKSGFAFSSIRSKIILFISGLLLIAIPLCIGSAQWLLNKLQRDTVHKSIEQTEDVLDNIFASRKSELKNQIKLIGALPILRAVVDSKDGPTIKDTAQSYSKDLDLPIFDVLDPKGKFLAGLDPDRKGTNLGYPQGAITKAAESGTISTFFMTRKGVPILAALGPVGAGRDLSGVLVLGMVLDDAFAQRTKKLTGAEVSFILDSKIQSTSLEGTNSKGRQWLEEALSSTKENIIESKDWILKSQSLTNFDNNSIGKIVIQSSLAKANEERKQISVLISKIGIITLLFALIGGYLISKSIADPIVSLKTLTEEIIKTNDLSRRTPIKGKDETAALSQSFNHLIAEVQADRVKLEDYSKNLEKMVEQRTAELKTANDRITTLLNNLGQGFMVINESGVVEPGASLAATDFLEADPVNKKFSELLNKDDPSSQTFDAWCSTVYMAFQPFDNMKDLAPKVHQNKKGRYIELDYRPIYKADHETVDKIICIASDKTEEKRLREKAEQERQTAQMVLRFSKYRKNCLNLLRETRQVLKRALSSVKNSNFDLVSVRRDIHTIKGGCMTTFSQLATPIHELETEIEILVDKGAGTPPLGPIGKLILERLTLVRNDFEKLLTEYSDVIGNLDESDVETRAIPVAKLINFAEVMKKASKDPAKLQAAFWQEFVLDDLSQPFEQYKMTVTDLSTKLNKKVQFQNSPAGISIYSKHYSDLIQSFVHAFRNAVDHGIEHPATRLQSGKPEHGTINVTYKKLADNMDRVQIIVEDDGKGISADRIKQKAAEKKLLSPEQLEKLDEKGLLQLVFMNGFSTAESVGEISGRGIGLEAISFEAQKLGGKTWVESEVGKGSRLIVEVPLIREEIV